MPLTDHSNFVGIVREGTINGMIRTIMGDRPSLFNYGTEAFLKDPVRFCHPIFASRKAKSSGDPLFTIMDPIPVLATPYPIGLNWCLQFRNAALDLHPNNVVTLPPQLGRLRMQRIALRLEGCFGLGCPDESFFEEHVPLIEEKVTTEKDIAKRFGNLTPKEDGPPIVPLLKPMRCFCLDLFVVAHFEWGTIGDSALPWLKVRLDGLEIVDLGPDELEQDVECYLTTILRLGVLPRLAVSIETMTLNITKTMSKWGVSLLETVLITPTPISARVPFNPSVAQDRLKIFVDVSVTVTPT